MKIGLEKPHRLFALLAITIFITGYVWTSVNEPYAIDIPLHDTYLVLAPFFLTTFIAVLILIISLTYWVGTRAKFQYSKWLTIGHFISLILLFTTPFLKLKLVKELTGLHAFENNNLYNLRNYPSTLVAVLIWLSIAFFVLNLIVGFLKKGKY